MENSPNWILANVDNFLLEDSWNVVVKGDDESEDEEEEEQERVSAEPQETGPLIKTWRTKLVRTKDYLFYTALGNRTYKMMNNAS
jgi:hypothetical protein